MAFDTSAHASRPGSGASLLGRAVRFGLDSAGALPVLGDLTALGSRVALGVALLHGPTARMIISAESSAPQR